jgi:hypothetical protein
MCGDAGDRPPAGLASALQFKREHEAGELGLAVGRHRLIAVLGVQIVEVDGAGRCGNV